MLFLCGAPDEKGINKCVRKYQYFLYPNIALVIRSVLYLEILVLEPMDNVSTDSEKIAFASNSEEQQSSTSRDEDFLPSTDSFNHSITETRLITSFFIDLELKKL